MGKHADNARGLASVTLSLRSEEAALILHAALVAYADSQSAVCEAMTAAGDPDGADYALAAAIAERIARTVAEQLDQLSVSSSSRCAGSILPGTAPGRIAQTA
jgi:hypothetical protein